MKKKITTSQIIKGMYIHSLGSSWLNHDFTSNQFLVENNDTLKKLKVSKLKTVTIDTNKGVDVPEEEPRPSVSPVKPTNIVKPLFPETTAADISAAKKTYNTASVAIKNLMNDARAGKELKPEDAHETAENIITAIDRNPHAMNAATRIKTRDEYTFQHSIGVTTLLTGFAESCGYDLKEKEEVAIGGIMHDIGKIHIPDSILNKPDKLTNEEFITMKKHVTFSREIFEEDNNFSRIETDIALFHHERPDGKGYPLGFKDDEIPEIGYMGAIVDVYDALSTKRVYKEAWEPSIALKNMVNWGPGQFNISLLQRFIKYLGVYPVGTWIKLESGLVGFILSQTEDLLEPVVQVKLNTKNHHLLNKTYDLRKHKNDKIKAVISPASLGLDDDFAI